MAQFFRQNQPRFDNYRMYLPALRIDFRYRCAYCERPESAAGGGEFFEIDHFRPSSRFPELLNEYSNLYYSCSKCNRHKAGKWPSGNMLKEGYRFADPCAEDMYVVHMSEREDGLLQPSTSCGEYTIAHIGLNLRPALIAWRLSRQAIRSDLASREHLVERLSIILAAELDDRRRREMELELDSLRRSIARDRALYLDS